MVCPSLGNHFECISIRPKLNKEIQILCLFHWFRELGKADEVILDEPLHLFLLAVDDDGDEIASEDVEALQLGGSLIDDLFICAVTIIHNCINITSIHVGLSSQITPWYYAYSEIGVLSNVPVDELVMISSWFRDGLGAWNQPSSAIEGGVVFSEDIVDKVVAIFIYAWLKRLEDK